MIKCGAVVFLASFSLMAIEIVAGRILAPFLGVSLYTWTSIVGVVLAGISLGAWLGGVIADRYPRFSTLGWILLFSAVTAFSISPLAGILGGTYFSGNLMFRTLFITAVVFLIPSCFLGMVSPISVKLALTGIEGTGSVAGTLYAISTAGSILGTFASGFFLISFLGTRNLLFITGLLLLLSALLLLELRKAMRTALLVAAFVLVCPFHYYRSGPRPNPDMIFFKESDYYTIRLMRSPGDDGERLVTLYLDQSTHSCSDLNDPFNLQYRYIRSYREIVGWRFGTEEAFATLSIGGGGYTFPRFLETKYPKARIDVVEIDPVVTRVSKQYLGVAPASRIRTFNEDGRWFVMNHEEQGTYDLILLDAFNDLSIPYHLTTREFALELKRLLAEDGLLVANVIDRFEEGSFLPAYIRTLESVFGTRMVHLITMGPAKDSKEIDNYVVIANMGIEDARMLTRGLCKTKPPDRVSYIMPYGELRDRLAAFRPTVLTDDYAPVDNLTAENFR
jgi:spermidine synthase